MWNECFRYEVDKRVGPAIFTTRCRDFYLESKSPQRLFRCFFKHCLKSQRRQQQLFVRPHYPFLINKLKLEENMLLSFCLSLLSARGPEHSPKARFSESQAAWEFIRMPNSKTENFACSPNSPTPNMEWDHLPVNKR